MAGYKLTSMYGILGFYELPVSMQYLLSILLVTGVINAFNLMDGIDIRQAA
ncbi:MAG: hypothetical protein IPG00_02950 [Saprospiraceae bacterium]|nr:hypothetical protein [Saprospiraceae bacterium]